MQRASIIEHADVMWLASRTDYTLDELHEMSGLPVALLDALVECGALPTTGTARRFRAESIELARAARRLSDHFELDRDGLAVAVSLLRRVVRLEAALTELRSQGSQATKGG